MDYEALPRKKKRQQEKNVIQYDVLKPIRNLKYEVEIN